MIRRDIATPALALFAVLALAAPVAAHAELESTSPADGEELTTPPTEVVMTFGGELDPDGSGFTVTAEDGTEVGTGSVDLQVADRNVIRGAVDITEPGVFTVSWTSQAADGHPEEGTFTFTVLAEEADAGSQDTPDTAVPTTGPSPMLVAGLILLSAAILVGGRRLATARA